MAMFPPAGPLEVVFSFDTTGSMYSCLEQVRGRINDMIQRLQADIPGIKTAVIAHGDYCDSHIYVTKWVDFTADIAELCDFVNKAERTSGGDGPECYELVLHQTRTRLSWTPFSRRVLVMIGDAEPHGTDYPDNKDKIDWKFETQELAKMGVTIYPVQCGNYGHTATAFYKTLSTVTKGKHLRLDDFGNLFDVLMAVCYREGDDTAKLASYEKEVRARCGSAPLAHDIDTIFSSLRDGDGDASSDSSSMDTTTTLPIPIVAFPRHTPPITPKVKAGVKKAAAGGAARLPLKSPLRRGKSAVTSKKYAKRTTVSDLLDVYREDKLRLLKRENVPNTNFKLRSLNWSPWKFVMSPELPDKKPKDWVKRRGGLHGYRLKTLNLKPNRQNLPRDHGKSVVLYEVSVQTPLEHRVRYRHNVVYTSFSKRCFDNTQWERCLLARVKGQVERLMTDGCRIFMRFYKLSLRDDVSSLRSDLKRYDYAWKTIRNVRTQPRSLIRGDHYISGSASS